MLIAARRWCARVLLRALQAQPLTNTQDEAFREACKIADLLSAIGVRLDSHLVILCANASGTGWVSTLSESQLRTLLAQIAARGLHA